MKLLLVASAGGHLAEVERLLPAFEGHQLTLLTYHSPRGNQPLPGIRTYLVNNIGRSPRMLTAALPTILRALIRDRPQVVVSTGSEIAIPTFYLARLLRIRTIFIESWCRVSTPSGSGKLVYPVSDVFLVQWEGVLDRYGPRAQFWGRVL